MNSKSDILKLGHDVAPVAGSRDALGAGFRGVIGCRRQDIYTGLNYVYTWQCCVTRAYYSCGVKGVPQHTTTQDTHRVILGKDKSHTGFSK